MADTGKGKVYENRSEAENAAQNGETVDWSQVNGDDGLTDDQRRQKKYELGEYAKGGDQPSAGNSTERSSEPTQKNEPSVEANRQSSAPTTVSPSTPAPAVSSTVTSTAGSGAAATPSTPVKAAEKK